MSKQIYIDSNGNEIQVSGTVNSADMLPITAGSSKMTSEAIGTLSSLTTTNKDSLVDAVNEVNGGLANTYTKSEVDTELSNKTNKSTINIYSLSSSNPITIFQTGSYHAFLIIGFVQGIGVVNLLAKITNNSTSVIDFVTGNAFSNANLTFAYNPTTKVFVIQTSQAGTSILTIMRGGSA